MRIAPQVRGIDRKIANVNAVGAANVSPSYNFVPDLERFAPGIMGFVH